MSSGAVEGANALKLDNEIIHESTSETSEELSLQTQEVVLENKEEKNDSLILKNEYKEEEQAFNGLENFQIEDDTPELFDSENSLESESTERGFSSFMKEKNDEEDELEIPAFLRRQKN